MTARLPYLAALVAIAIAGLTGCGGGAEEDDDRKAAFPPNCAASGFCS